MYEDDLRLIGKRVVDFLLVLLNFFSLVVTVEFVQFTAVYCEYVQFTCTYSQLIIDYFLSISS